MDREENGTEDVDRTNLAQDKTSDRILWKFS
jgi:hypothetical protein